MNLKNTELIDDDGDKDLILLQRKIFLYIVYIFSRMF